MMQCKYYGRCGGCTTQHIEYPTQVKNKTNLVSRAVGFTDVKSFFDSPYNYRNRMDFHFHKKGIGLREKGNKHGLIDVDDCPISNEGVNKLLTELKAFFNDNDSYDPIRKAGTFICVSIRKTGIDSGLNFVLNDESMKLTQATERIKEYAKISGADNIVITYSPYEPDENSEIITYAVKGEEFMKERLLDREFFFPVQGFFQNNTEVAGMMQKYVKELIDRYGFRKETLVDLYGGVGTFGILNAESFSKVFIIEEFAKAIDAAKMNAGDAEIEKIECRAMKAHSIKKLGLKAPLTVIVDPPRSGMDPKTILSLLEKSPEVIIYISCNPLQLGKELDKLKKTFKIVSAAMFDMFPQTSHAEAVVELVKRKEKDYDFLK
ncbi:MAG: 23S rRNA (uracil(1939)-C(5))-methyltransferase RlmD [Nanoarchaeota archaeon]|nr:23S rRNA (uracil(1939)-C(5))-methyltransferase RlmD [Nanoarchaeota archaeon]